MHYDIHYAPDATKDLENIFDYIYAELENPKAALRMVEKIQDDISGLEFFANMGAPLSSLTGIESDYRLLVSGHYLSFYRVVEKTVYIDRILYGKRDYLRILLRELPE